ncbi:hypothetical protein QA601_13320 [Chitinispirillales bacterium ANBcel5]|uniref:hypothetical protein n=1 Tax=Cellulosispirillum alkaliphilum TaxID=3039283 RepID=UPI002A58E50E|nr:hypothetical protein [Chitinispirillales bacterium ANBcel5]
MKTFVLAIALLVALVGCTDSETDNVQPVQTGESSSTMDEMEHMDDEHMTMHETMMEMGSEMMECHDSETTDLDDSAPSSPQETEDDHAAHH